MSTPSSGDYGDASQSKALAGVRTSITKYDEVFDLGIESGNRWLDDALFPVTIILPLTTAQFNSATFVVNYHTVLIFKQHLHADQAECDKWEARRDNAFNKLKEKIEAQTSQSNTAKTFTSRSKYRSIRLRSKNPV